MKSKHHKLVHFVISIIFISVFVMIYFSPGARSFFSNPDNLKELIISTGSIAPLIYAITVALSVMFLPLPGQVVIALGGLIFGVFQGFFFAWIGKLIGTTIAFYLSRRLGSKFVGKMLDKKEIAHFNAFLTKRGTYALLFSYFIPLFPNDTITMVTALSKIKFKRFFTIAMLGFIPNLLIITIFGDELAKSGINIRFVIVTVLIITLIIIYTYKHKLKILLIKDIKEIEHEAIKAEKAVVHEAKIIEKVAEKDVKIIGEEITLLERLFGIKPHKKPKKRRKR